MHQRAVSVEERRAEQLGLFGGQGLDEGHVLAGPVGGAWQDVRIEDEDAVRAGMGDGGVVGRPEAGVAGQVDHGEGEAVDSGGELGFALEALGEIGGVADVEVFVIGRVRRFGEEGGLEEEELRLAVEADDDGGAGAVVERAVALDMGEPGDAGRDGGVGAQQGIAQAALHLQEAFDGRVAEIGGGGEVFKHAVPQGGGAEVMRAGGVGDGLGVAHMHQECGAGAGGAGLCEIYDGVEAEEVAGGAADGRLGILAAAAGDGGGQDRSAVRQEEGDCGERDDPVVDPADGDAEAALGHEEGIEPAGDVGAGGEGGGGGFGGECGGSRGWLGGWFGRGGEAGEEGLFGEGASVAGGLEAFSAAPRRR